MSHLRIVQISDTQIGFTDSRNRSRIAEERRVPKEAIPLDYSAVDREYFQTAVGNTNQLEPAPDVVLITGDLVDCADSERQWSDYTKTAASLNPPVYELMGNHEGFTEEGLARFRRKLKKNDFYSFTIKDVLFLVLNSNYLKEPERFSEQTRLHRVFAEEELDTHRAVKHKIILLHHPLYLEDPDESEDYFTLPPTQRQWVLGLVEEHNVLAVISGHYHRNHVIRYKNTALITTGPTSEPIGQDNTGQEAQRGFRVLDLDLNTGAINHEYRRIRR